MKFWLLKQPLSRVMFTAEHLITTSIIIKLPGCDLLAESEGPVTADTVCRR